MNRSTLVALLAEKFAHLTLHDAEMATATILEAMSQAMARGHRIELRGFGSFTVVRRAPRMGRNPRTGESVLVPARRVIHFKPSKALRAAADQGTAQLTPALPSQSLDSV